MSAFGGVGSSVHRAQISNMWAAILKEVVKCFQVGGSAFQRRICPPSPLPFSTHPSPPLILPHLKLSSFLLWGSGEGTWCPLICAILFLHWWQLLLFGFGGWWAVDESHLPRLPGWKWEASLRNSPCEPGWPWQWQAGVVVVVVDKWWKRKQRLPLKQFRPFLTSATHCHCHLRRTAKEAVAVEASLQGRIKRVTVLFRRTNSPTPSKT